jgi:RNA polymerase sigma factor (sigma-70 family)
VTDPRELGELIHGAQCGDGLAIAELLDTLAPAVGRWCGPIALRDADDAAQEAMIAILRGLRGLRDPAALFGWARAIAVREAVRVARRAAREQPAELADLPAPGDTVLAADIRDVLSRLAPEHRAVLMLRDLEGLDERTAAAVLRIPVGTVKSRLARARASFRKEWQA